MCFSQLFVFSTFGEEVELCFMLTKGAATAQPLPSSLCLLFSSVVTQHSTSHLFILLLLHVNTCLHLSPSENPHKSFGLVPFSPCVSLLESSPASVVLYLLFWIFLCLFLLPLHPHCLVLSVRGQPKSVVLSMK